MLNDKNYYRNNVIIGIIVVVIIIYIVQLFRLQVLENDLNQVNTAVMRQTIYPQRGLIYDRDSTLLVYNQPAYDITLIMNEMRKKDDYRFDTIAFCNILSIDTANFNKRINIIKKSKGYSPNTPQTFMTQLQSENIATLQELLHKFHGVYIQNRTIRNYTYPYAAHVLGSIGEVSQEDINKDNYYASGDYSGRDGIEKTYEKELRGEKGARFLMRDNKGVIQGAYKDGANDIPSVAGKNLQLTIDIELQSFAEQMLAHKVGSIVAIEPNTGEILVLASSPTWDPQLMVGRQRNKTYSELNQDPTKPLLNRALSSAYPPGSTFKTLGALVALQEGAITENTFFPCSGPGSTPIKCTHHHGSPNSLLKGIEQSCNPYFWYTYKAYLEKNGYGKNNEIFRQQYDKWRNAIMNFGLAGIFKDSDIGPHNTGGIYRSNSYDIIYGKTGWRALTIRSNSIGQGEITVTPLQMANYTAAIANEGYTFMNWTCDGGVVSTEPTYSFSVNRNAEYVAHFALPFSVSVTIDPLEGGSVLGEGEYDYGTTCTLSAIRIIHSATHVIIQVTLSSKIIHDNSQIGNSVISKWSIQNNSVPTSATHCHYTIENTVITRHINPTSIR